MHRSQLENQNPSSYNSPDQEQRDCRRRSNPSSAPRASGSSPSWSGSPGAGPPPRTRLPEQLRTNHRREITEHRPLDHSEDITTTGARERHTSAVPEVHVGGGVVFAQALQDLLVVTEAVQRPQNEDIQWDVTDLLQLKVPAETLQLAGRPARLLQLQQNFRLLVQAGCQRLWTGWSWVEYQCITAFYRYIYK